MKDTMTFVTMKKSLATVVALMATIVSATDLFVPSDATVTNFVAQGASETFSGRLAVAEGGVLAKTGGGALSVPSGAVAQHWPLSVEIVSGSVSFPQGDVENPIPAIMADAALWVSTKDPVESHLAQSGDKVSAWYDVRETDTVNRHYLYACVTNGTDLATRVTTNGVDSLYFGGVGSKVAMHFIEPGKTSASRFRAYSLFAVTGWYATQGAVFGSGSSSGNMFMFQIAKDVTHPLADPSRLWASTQRGNTYIDGIRCDPYADTPPVGGFHLFDSSSQIVPVDAVTGSFFAQWGAPASYWGGDYLAEAVVFTNLLSETERLSVSAYLSKKWFGSTGVRKDVSLGASGSLVVDATEMDVELRDAILSGSGTVVKKGDNAAYYRSAKAMPDEANGFDVALSVEAGSVDLSSRLSVAPEAGGRIVTSMSERGARRVSFAADSANELVKAGTGTVSVTGVAEGVTKLRINGGTLQINPVRHASDAPADDDEVYIENASFEDFKEDADATADKYYGLVNAAAYYKGWRRINNSSWIFDWPKSAFIRNSYKQTYAPLDGDCALMFHATASVFTPVKITKTGLYEVSFDCTGVDQAASLGNYLICSIVDESNGLAEVARFGRAYGYEATYRRVALRAEIPQIGDGFALKFYCCNYSGSAMVIDNVKLRRVTDRETGRWDVPNGDFEAVVDTIHGADAKLAILESPYDAWTFDQSAGRVEIVTMATTNSAWSAGFGCCSARMRKDDFRQLLLSRNTCSATVTCTPPAGTYYLRTDLGRFNQYRGCLTVTAKVGDAAAVTLGSKEVANSLMQTYTWPEAFTVTGTEEVVLTFAFARSQSASSSSTGIWIDDVRLVTYDDREFVSKGGFEVGVNLENWPVDTWTRLTGEADGTAQVIPYTYLPGTFTSDVLEGKQFLYFERTGGASQTVSFDHPGIYQLSFYAALSGRSYVEGWYRDSTPVRAWLADDAGATNVIGNTGLFVTTNFSQYVWNFRVEKPGSYTLGIQGTAGERGYCALVDAVSLRRLDESRFTAQTETALPDSLDIRLAAGARLRLDFEGTNSVRKLRLGGVLKHPGIVDATTDPDFIGGTGALRIDSMDGLMLIIR